MEKKSNSSLESWEKSVSNYNKYIYSFTHSPETYEAVFRWQACVRKCIRVCETFAAGSHPVPNVSGLNMSLFFRSQTYSRLFLGREAGSTIVHLVARMQLSPGSAMFGMLVVTGVKGDREGRSHFFRVLAQKWCTSHLLTAQYLN